MGGVHDNGRVRVVLCDDVAEIRYLLRLSLEESPDLQVVAEASDGREGIQRVRETAPDVVLLDLSMPGMDGLEAIPEIRAASPRTGIVVFSGFVAGRMGEQALARGADRYLEKGEALDVVRETIRDVARLRRAA